MLVGLVLGLAIYNSVLLDFPLPIALYKKLVGQPPSLRDLSDMEPTVGKSLRELLNYGGALSYVSCPRDSVLVCRCMQAHLFVVHRLTAAGDVTAGCGCDCCSPKSICCSRHCEQRGTLPTQTFGRHRFGWLLHALSCDPQARAAWRRCSARPSRPACRASVRCAWSRSSPAARTSSSPRPTGANTWMPTWTSTSTAPCSGNLRSASVLPDHTSVAMSCCARQPAAWQHQNMLCRFAAL